MQSSPKILVPRPGRHWMAVSLALLIVCGILGSSLVFLDRKIDRLAAVRAPGPITRVVRWGRVALDLPQISNSPEPFPPTPASYPEPDGGQTALGNLIDAPFGIAAIVYHLEHDPPAELCGRIADQGRCEGDWVVLNVNRADAGPPSPPPPPLGPPVRAIWLDAAAPPSPDNYAAVSTDDGKTWRQPDGAPYELDARAPAGH